MENRDTHISCDGENRDTHISRAKDENRDTHISRAKDVGVPSFFHAIHDIVRVREPGCVRTSNCVTGSFRSRSCNDILS